MREKNKCTVLILAAGQSTRLGKPKQLLPWKNSTLIEHTISQAKLSNADKIIVILGAYADLIIPHIASIEGIRYVVNNNWKQGMLSTIKTGLSACENSTVSILIMLADQPAIHFSYLDSLMAEFDQSEKSIVATKYNQKLGVPAVFSKEHFKNLKNLSKNSGGAQFYIEKNSNDVLTVEPTFNLFDIDTIEEYEVFYTDNH